MEFPDTARVRTGIQNWLEALDNYPGWKEWKRGHFAHTLWYGDPPSIGTDLPDSFTFDRDTEHKHAVCMRFLELPRTISTLRDLEYYFRRFPFRGVPVSRYEHVTNVCEMYFNRFYEFRSRSKALFEGIKLVTPSKLEFGKFIKAYDKAFDSELRARNGIHHHQRFDSVSIDQLMLTQMIDEDHPEKGWRAEHLRAYRRVAREWGLRIRRRAGRCI